jgi:hypothetical protein
VGDDSLAEGARTRLGRAAAYGRSLGSFGYVGSLCQHRAGERHYLLDGRVCGGGHSVRALTCPDPGLDVAWAERAFHLDLQLTEAGMVAADRGAQVGIDVQGELSTGLIDQQQA